MNEAYLTVRDLRVHFSGRAGLIKAVDGCDLTLAHGERFGLIGESGSGKTMVALSLMGLLPGTARLSGSIRLGETELTTLDHHGMRRLRGRELAMIFEQPAAYLDPVFSIGRQIGEAIETSGSFSRAEVRRKVIELLHRVHMPEPEHRINAYPFQLSGGMQQRVMIAMALAGRPRLLLADEPTTALDPTVQAHILTLLDTCARESAMALVLITHDLSAVRRLCSRAAVMYAGRIVEEGRMEEVLDTPRHPYTQALTESLSGRSLRPIPGNPPSLADLPTGCCFHPRCPLATQRCTFEEPAIRAGVRCHFRHAT